MSVGSKIKALRERSGWTQDQLASALGVSNRTISTWEIGTREPRMGMITMIANLFNVTVRKIRKTTDKISPGMP